MGVQCVGETLVKFATKPQSQRSTSGVDFTLFVPFPRPSSLSPRLTLSLLYPALCFREASLYHVHPAIPSSIQQPCIHHLAFMI